MIRKLLKLIYPKQWRQDFGDEYLVLLEDMDLNAQTVIDSISAAIFSQLRRDIVLLGLYAALFIAISVTFQAMHIRTNILPVPVQGVSTVQTILVSAIGLLPLILVCKTLVRGVRSTRKGTV